MFFSQFPQYSYSYMIPYQPIQPQQIQVMKLFIPKLSYFQNEVLKGEVLITPPHPIILQDIIVKLRIIENWTCDQSEGMIYEDKNDQIILQFPLQIGKILNNETQFKNLNIGEYRFPFSLKIPNNIPPSFEFFSINKRGSIRYSVITEFLSPYVKCAFESLIIIKSIACELNVPLQLSNTSNVHKWGVFDKGNTTLNVSYSTSNYKIKEEIPLKITINNTRGKINVTSCNFSIIKKVTFTNKTQKTNFPIEKKIYEYKYPIKINVGSINSFNFSLFVNDNDISNLNLTGIFNPYPNIKDYNVLMPCVNSLLIKCRYFIHISLSFDSKVTEIYKPKIDLPIWITHQSINEINEIERIEDEELRKAIEISKIEYMSNNNSNVNLIDNDNFNQNNFKNINYDNNDINNDEPINLNNINFKIPNQDNYQDNIINNEEFYENRNNYPNINQNNYLTMNSNQNNNHQYMISNTIPNQMMNNINNNNNQNSNINKKEFITPNSLNNQNQNINNNFNTNMPSIGDLLDNNNK